MTIEEVRANPNKFRFKTEAEFITEFGTDWKDRVPYKWNSDGDMDYLLGKSYSEVSTTGWLISTDMLIQIGTNPEVLADYRTYGNILH